MSPKEERVWRYIISNRLLSAKTVAHHLGVEEEYVEAMMDRIASANWQMPIKARDPDPRLTSVGESAYHKKRIQPWDIWLEYGLNPWDADIVKRVLRRKPGQRRLDYEKIIHVCQERIRQIDNSKNKEPLDAGVAEETSPDN